MDNQRHLLRLLLPAKTVEKEVAHQKNLYNNCMHLKAALMKQLVRMVAARGSRKFLHRKTLFLPLINPDKSIVRLKRLSMKSED